MKSTRTKFSIIPDVSEQSKQKRSSDMNMSITQFRRSKGDMAAGSVIPGGCSSEDGYRKAPGVVARLMGLDSLPTSSFNNTQSNRFFDSRYVRNRIELEQKDYKQIDRKHRVIDKFETESFPPKSTKLVPVTRHKLPLLPVKSSRIVSSDDPDRITQVASKTPSRKPSMELNAARSLKGQSMNKSWDGCLERKPFMEDGKMSVSLALQAKINVKKRQCSSTTPKKPSANSVLKHNNQKQNCLNGRGKPSAKSPATLTKPVSGTPANPNKIVNQSKRDKNTRSRHVVKSNGSDVVSFTFTSPISRTTKSSTDKKNPFLADNHGTLFDQKLKELTATCFASVSRESFANHRGAQINRTTIHKDDSCSSNGKASINPLFKDQERVAVSSKKIATMEVETESEPSYVNDILFNIKSMFEDFASGRAQKIVNPRLFDILEAKRPVFGKKNEGKLRRKLVFDCVSECVDSRFRVWRRGFSIVRRRKQLVKEVCKKILWWETMKDCIVDELVDKDMSCDEHQKWLDFDVEVFEIGVEIETRLLNSLINEAVAAILVLKFYSHD